VLLQEHIRQLFEVTGLESIPRNLTERESHQLAKGWWDEYRMGEHDYNDYVNGMKVQNINYTDRTNHVDARVDPTQTFQHWPGLPTSDYYNSLRPRPKACPVEVSLDSPYFPEPMDVPSPTN
jgi:hypothetical protein